MGFQKCYLLLKPLWQREIILILSGQILAPSQLDASVERRRQTEVPLMIRTNSCIGKLLHDLRRIVPGAVINNDQLEVVI